MKNKKCLKKIYALQLDESTDITDKALLLIYIRYVDWDEKDIKEEFKLTVCN